jgi:hypothetical protein
MVEATSVGGLFRFAIAGRNAHLRPMPRKLPELPLEVARAFLADMRAFFAAGHNQIKKDEIAARQLWILKQHWNGKLRIIDSQRDV